MSRAQWYVIGVIIAVAFLTAALVKRRADAADKEASGQSQLPAEEAAANYNVPPSVGVGENAPTGVTYNGVTYTTGAANAIPLQG